MTARTYLRSGLVGAAGVILAPSFVAGLVGGCLLTVAFLLTDWEAS